MQTIQIGTIQFPSSLFMAPMEGITDIPFRAMVRKHGCGVTCTQMIHAEGLLRGNQHRMHEVTALEAKDVPVGIQLCGSDAQNLSEAAKKSQDMGAAFVDLNMGCPAKNVVARGAGAALLRDPELCGQILDSMVKAVTIPVTIKIRAGWDSNLLSGLEIAQLAEKAGVALVSVHGRTKAQKHTGQSDWDLFNHVKDKVKIPVVGNGGVYSIEDVKRMQKTTRVDGVMIARGALGNPWLFEYRIPTVKEIKQTLLEHFDAHLRFYPNVDTSVITFRKHIVWYTKGLPQAASFRKALFKIKELQLVMNGIHEYFDQLPMDMVPHRDDATFEEPGND